MKVIPGRIMKITEGASRELEDLMRRFGRARRRAYSLKWKGYWAPDIERILVMETGLNLDYVRDAYYSIKHLPPHVTFGGRKNQKLRMEGKISKEEYRKRRNSILVSRSRRNTLLDLDTLKLRINCSNGRFIYPKIYIPQSCLREYEPNFRFLPYTVIIKRVNNDMGYRLRFILNEADGRPINKIRGSGLESQLSGWRRKVLL